ncbi:LuxR C-terminal-related transcriptional regulator [Variovorax sp. KK3]|uniref:helix-turn-helix transcriptional regulator n=1 Tax=Variovorax sp. KK3 TaxID=1855728 RepID=UPI00117CCA2A|nr:LuxR C-terminal-related transcriptional regulator [Variovorax sp. KK3]
MAPDRLVEAVRQGGSLLDSAGEFANVLAAMPVERGVIVLDDVHCIEVPQVFEFLGLLIERLPNHWTLVLASRTDPPLPLSRFRADRNLEEICESDLRFSDDETQRLCVAAGLDQADDARRLLRERTNGWAAGLCISLEVERHSNRTNAVRRQQQQRHMFDFLASEVLGQMPQELRDFLLTCSVLPELTERRCRAVSGHPRTSELLEEIERRGLFVTVLEGDELALRLHDLFREFLEERLRRDAPERIPPLLRLAAQLEPDRARRLQMLLRAGMWVEAEHELADAAGLLITDENSSLVLRLVDQFPERLRDTSPVLAFARGLCAMAEMDWPALGFAMAKAAKGFAEAGRHRDAYEARVYEVLGLMFLQRAPDAHALIASLPGPAPDSATRALVSLISYWDTGHNGPPQGPAVHLAAMVDHLHAANRPDLWYQCTPRVFLFIGRAGVRPHMERFVTEARVAAGERPGPLAAAGVLSAWLHLWSGAIDEAGETIRQIEADSRWLGHPRSLQVPLMRLRAICCALEGDVERARSAQEALIRDADEPRRHIGLRVMNLSLACRSAAALDDWEGVRRAIGPLRLLAEVHPDERWPLHETVEACIALHEGRASDALVLLQHIVLSSRASNRVGLDAFVRVQLCRAELRAGNASAAWDAVAPLVAHFQASGECGGVLLNGSTSLHEIARGRWDGVAPADGREVLRQWVEMSRAPSGTRPDDAPAPSNEAGLSPREMSVLRRLAAGHSNKVIAAELGLSPHTIKRHVARILERLDVTSRLQAAAWLAGQEAQTRG